MLFINYSVHIACSSASQPRTSMFSEASRASPATMSSSTFVSSKPSTDLRVQSSRGLSSSTLSFKPSTDLSQVGDASCVQTFSTNLCVRLSLLVNVRMCCWAMSLLVWWVSVLRQLTTRQTANTHPHLHSNTHRCQRTVTPSTTSTPSCTAGSRKKHSSRFPTTLHLQTARQPYPLMPSSCVPRPQQPQHKTHLAVQSV